MTRILLIEDEHHLREQVAEYLGYEGFDVLCAADGMQGLEIAQTNQLDLIVSDIAMPVMDGYGLLTELQKQPQTATIPFIFLTAKADRPAVRLGMELGADDYVTKPFTAQELIGAINSRLRKHETVALATTQEIDRVKSQLAKTVSVDLRTPVAAIMATQRKLTEQWNDLSIGEVNTLFNTLQDGTHQLHHIVEQMVMLTQFESGALDPEPLQTSSVEVGWLALLAAAINQTHQFTARNIDRSVKLRAVERDGAIRCHLQAMTYALAESIVNVLAMTPDGSQVVITQWNRDDISWVRILADSAQNTSYEPSEQDARDVGLSLARRIVEAHGGRLEFRADTGQGTGIMIQLPNG